MGTVDEDIRIRLGFYSRTLFDYGLNVFRTMFNLFSPFTASLVELAFAIVLQLVSLLLVIVVKNMSSLKEGGCLCKGSVRLSARSLWSLYIRDLFFLSCSVSTRKSRVCYVVDSPY